jgi:nitroreductase
VYLIAGIVHDVARDEKDLSVLKTAKSERSINPLVAARWSPYGYSSKPVPTEDIAAMFEAASWAASAFNEQPWRYLMASQADDADGFERLLGCLVPANQAWAQAAPVLALSVVQHNFSRNDNPNRVALHDLGAASATLTLEATARGIAVHQMSGVNVDHARTVCGVPEGFDVIAALAIGYVSSSDDVAEELRNRDANPRTRKSLDTYVFSSKWEDPAAL